MKHYFLLSILLLGYPTFSHAEIITPLQQVIAGEHRSEEHKSRDQFRHPEQTLDFFEVKADMTVVEIWPGGKAWYTEILAPYLKEKGTLYAAHFAANSDIPYFTKNLKLFEQKIKAQPKIYGNIIVTTLYPPSSTAIAPEGSADRILTFRNIHNWMKRDQADTVFKAMYKALKKGGILGIVEHRGLADSKQDPKAISGYVTEAHVIALAKKAGFTFIGNSEINANSKDKTNHPKGVWSLPPSLKLKELDKEKYLAIGESDRMTLKFIKN